MTQRIDAELAESPDKNLGGRPRLELSPVQARRMQRVLMHYRSAIVSPSSVTGRYLTVRGQAYWVYLCEARYPPNARHAMVLPNRSEDEFSDLHAQATAEVRRALLARHDRHFAALRRGELVSGVRLHPSRDPRAGDAALRFSRAVKVAHDRHGSTWEVTPYRVAGIPGVYYRDVSTPLGDKPGEPSKREIRARRDAVVEVRQLTRADLERRRELYTSEVDEVAVAERVAELLRFDERAERQLRRLLQRARRFEFVHLGLDRGGKPRAPGARAAHRGTTVGQQTPDRSGFERVPAG